MTFKQAVVKSGLTMEQVETLQQAAVATWQYIGGDILTSLAESTGETSVPRRDVVELVLDANHIDRQLKDKDILSYLNQPWKTMPKDHYEVVTALVLPAFPFNRYGW